MVLLVAQPLYLYNLLQYFGYPAKTQNKDYAAMNDIISECIKNYKKIKEILTFFDIHDKICSILRMK